MLRLWQAERRRDDAAGIGARVDEAEVGRLVSAAALAAYRHAEARLADFAACVARLAPERRAFPARVPLEERFNDLECVRLAALRRLLRAPAPDLAALKADARRLAYGG